ncbi:MAG: protein translocase subunit SecD [Armatimonadota bacterium]
MRIKHTHLLGIIAALLVIAVYIDLNAPGIRQWSDYLATKLGLDLAGGIRVVLQLEKVPGVTIDQDTQEQVVKVIRNRVDALGVAEPLIQPKGKDQVVVEISESKSEKGQPLDKRKTIQTLQKTAKLEFIYLANVKSDRNPFAPYEYDGTRFIERATKRTLSDQEVREKILYADPKNIILTGRNLKPGAAQASINSQTGEVETLLELDREGTAKFAEFTRNHIGDLLAIVYDGKVESAPRIQSEIPNGSARITHGQGADLKVAVEQAALLNSGALPVPLKVVAKTEVEPTLGADSIQAMKLAGAIGLGAVLVFMLAYYLLPGLLADLALLFYAILTFAIFKLLHVTLTLPGIAGFILSIGMAVDANILIFERLKEELKSGKPLHAAIDAGFKRAFTSIFDSNMSTLITCLILGWFGTGPIRGFAITLSIGVLVSMFTAITVTRTILHVVVNRPWAQQEWLFGVRRSWVAREGKPGLNIIGRRNVYFVLSGLVVVPGLIFILMGGLKKGIDFTGGTLMEFNFPKPVPASQIRAALASIGMKDASVQLAGAARGAEVFIRSRELDDAARQKVVQTLQSRFKDAKLQSTDTIGGVISRELTRKAFLSVLFASIAIVVYLSFRFAPGGFVTGLKYGVTAVIALIHDVLVVTGIFAIMGYVAGWEIDSLFVTALLTVIGFSVHDTIVIFDRIRENVKNRTKDDVFEDLVNRSVNQTLARSINTSLTVVLTLTALVIWGGPVIRLFVVALLIGVVSGTYSSIFNASPLLVVWEQVAARRRRAAAATAAAVRRPADVALRPSAPRPAVQPAATAAQDSGSPMVSEGVVQKPAPAKASKSKSKPRQKSKRRF